MDVGRLVRSRSNPDWGVGVVVSRPGPGGLEVRFEVVGLRRLPWPEYESKVDAVDPIEVDTASALRDPARWHEIGPRQTVTKVVKKSRARPEAAQPCRTCREPLNRSIPSRDGKWKSCPACSTDDGVHHVFREHPAAFGLSLRRVSSKHPDGRQSWCEACRLDKAPTAVTRACHRVEK